MRELSVKLIEAGVIPKQAIQLMKLWRSLPEDLPEDERIAQTEEELLKMVMEIETIMEKNDEMSVMKETDLDLDKLIIEEIEIQTVVGAQNLLVSILGGRTRDGKFVINSGRASGSTRQAELAARRGNVVEYHGKSHMILNVEPRYVGDDLEYYVCTVEKKHADL